jgi:hypothetical protein
MQFTSEGSVDPARAPEPACFVVLGVSDWKKDKSAES